MREFEQIEQIIAAVGKDAAMKLCQMFAGENVYFPKNALVYLKYEKIREEFAAGASYRALSLKYDLTTRQIRKITAPEHLDPNRDVLWLFGEE